MVLYEFCRYCIFSNRSRVSIRRQSRIDAGSKTGSKLIDAGLEYTPGGGLIVTVNNSKHMGKHMGEHMYGQLSG